MLSKKIEAIKLLMQGDKSEFEKIFYEFFPKLYRFSYDFVKDRDLAREITHETFIKLWESKNNLQTDTNLEAFLFTICRNQCLNFIKHQKVIQKYREIKYVEHIEQEFLGTIINDYDFNRIDFENLEKKIRQSVANLPEQCRLVFKLSRFQNKKYSEIATQLNIAVKTVEAHISLALKKLRADLKEFL